MYKKTKLFFWFFGPDED